VANKSRAVFRLSRTRRLIAEFRRTDLANIGDKLVLSICGWEMGIENEYIDKQTNKQTKNGLFCVETRQRG
jgi:hypothetical protein